MALYRRLLSRRVCHPAQYRYANRRSNLGLSTVAPQAGVWDDQWCMIMGSAVPRQSRVAHLTSVHTPLDPRIVYKECVALAEAGYDVVVIAPGEGSLPAGVRLHSVPAPRNRIERMTRTVWQVFRAALEERAEVYHFHDPELMGVGVALRLAGARVVFDVHEDIPGDIADKPWIAAPVRRPLAYAAALFLKMLQRAYSGVVTATPAIARRFPNRHTVVVCNYPRIEEFSQERGEDFERRSACALYIGSITELRCIEEIVSSFASPSMDSHIRLHLAGTFESPALEQRVQQLPGWERVDYLGLRPRSEVAGLLRGRAWDCCCFVRLQITKRRCRRNSSSTWPRDCPW